MLESAAPAPARRWKLLASASIVALLVGLLAVWWVGRQAVLHVTTSTGVPDCTGTTPMPHEWEMGSGFRQTAIPLRDGFVCRVTVKVSNDSNRELSLGRTLVGFGGDRSGAGFRVTHIGNYEVPEDGATDAVVDLEQTISPHRSLYLDLRIVYRKGSCNERGSATAVQPSIEVSHRLSSRDLVVADFPLFTGTPGSCDT